MPVNKTNNKAALTKVPIKIQGLNLPHLVLVLSTIFPRIGSITNSAILITTINPVIKPISLSATD
ncbi:Uncharacterised protein [Chlamydia trachomatis]|nr:Uncharacterised protein [Chlamydia trachomatis]